jgi:hypothetical protein
MLNINQTENADYRVKINIRNERLLRAIENKGFPSVRQFCFYVGENYEAINKIIRGAEKPLKDNGELKPLVKTLLKHLDIKMEDAFTERQLEGFKRSTYTLKVGEKELMQIASPRNAEMNLIEQDVSNVLNKILTEQLNSREEKVVRLKMKDISFRDIGEMIGNISGTRTAQIFEKALRKLRKNDVAKKLIDAGVGDVFTKVDLSNKNLFKDKVKDLFINFDGFPKDLKQKIKNKAEEMNEVPFVINHFKLKNILQKGKKTFKNKMLFKVEQYYDQINFDRFMEYTVGILFKYDYLIDKLETRSVFKFSDRKNYVFYSYFNYKNLEDYLNRRISYFEKKEAIHEMNDIWMKGKKYFIERQSNEKD